MHQAVDRAQFYDERRRKFEAEAEALGARSRLLSNLRGLAFALFVIGGLFALFGSSPLPSTLLCVSGAIAFGVLVVRHARVIEAEDSARRWAKVNEYAF